MSNKKITKEEFEQTYANNMGITIEELKDKYGFEAVPCDCDYKGCKGWQAIFNLKSIMNNQMEKTLVKIENWSLILVNYDPYKAPELQRQNLRGQVYDHPRFKDGTEIVSSYITEMDLKKGIIATHSGTEYSLGRPASHWMRWLEEQEYIEYLDDLKNLFSHFPN